MLLRCRQHRSESLTAAPAPKQPPAGVQPTRLVCRGLGARSSQVCSLSRWMISTTVGGSPRRGSADSPQIVQRGSATGRAAGRPQAAAGCAERTNSGSPGGRVPRGRGDFCNRGEPGVSRPIKAAARRLPSASRDSGCASSGRCSRPAARGETAERVGEPAARRPTKAATRCVTSASSGSACASSGRCSCLAARGETAECAAEHSLGVGGGELVRVGEAIAGSCPAQRQKGIAREMHAFRRDAGLSRVCA